MIKQKQSEGVQRTVLGQKRLLDFQVWMALTAAPSPFQDTAGFDAAGRPRAQQSRAAVFDCANDVRRARLTSVAGCAYGRTRVTEKPVEILN